MANYNLKVNQLNLGIIRCIKKREESFRSLNA